MLEEISFFSVLLQNVMPNRVKSLIAHNSIVFRDMYLQCPVFQQGAHQNTLYSGRIIETVYAFSLSMVSQNCLFGTLVTEISLF